MKTTLSLLALVVLLLIVGGVYVMIQHPAPAGTACTLEAKRCPDGSYVGRTGPNCAFAACPGEDGSDISQNLTLGIDSNTALGQYLIGYNGMTLYAYANDTQGVSTCTGQCAQLWPPYVVPAGMHLNLQAYVTGAAGTIVRSDGTTQVTYEGKPLYFYSGDAASGDVSGQGVGNLWSVVKP